jgi:hypothetical protein
VVIEPLDQNQIDRLHARQQVTQTRLRASGFMQQGPTVRRSDQHLMSAREAVAMAVLTWAIHIEAVMGVFDGRNHQASRPQ